MTAVSSHLVTHKGIFGHVLTAVICEYELIFLFQSHFKLFAATETAETLCSRILIEQQHTVTYV